MRSVLDPFQFVVIAIAGWMNQHQQQVVEYLLEENRVLREQIGGRRMRFNDDQRRRLAVKATTLGRKLLARVATIVTPETLLAWHRKLIAEKYDGSASKREVADCRITLQELGGICQAWRSTPGFRIHCLRRCSRGSVPSMAGPSDNGPLECSRSHFRQGLSGGDRPRVSGRLHDSGAPNQSLSELTARQPRRSRPDRQFLPAFCPFCLHHRSPLKRSMKCRLMNFGLSIRRSD